MMKDYSIGDVSKIFDVSIDTLRYYDKIGLIKPRVNPNNRYRYYELEHLYLLAVVLEARYSEIPIKNIMDFIKTEDLDLYYEFFDQQEKELDKKINELKRIKDSVKRNKEEITEVKSFENNYNIESLSEKYCDKIFYKIKIKDLIVKTKCKRFSNIFDNGKNKAEYYLFYNLGNDSNSLDVERGYIYIEYCASNKDFIDDLKENNKVNLEEFRVRGNIISVKFLGTEKEMANYVNLIKNNRKSELNRILVKTISYIPRSSGVVYFTELLIKIF